MGTTTEPPWLHSSSGVATRNGTTTHTINFTTDGSTPFTPATGSMLAFVVFGAVTHTGAGAWSEKLQPVNSGELSLFTSTNNSVTAPPTSITLTHNASNYPIEWWVGELPAGSSYSSGASATPSADTFAALTGLTGGAGNERLILAGRGRTATSASETSASHTWTAPFVEDADLYTGFATTDGGTLAVGHQINNVATSVTPVSTPTYGGSWGTPDREQFVASFIAVAPSSTTPVSGTLDLRWTSYAQVTGSLDLRWKVANTVTGSTDLRWRVYNIVTATSALDLRWAVLNAVAGSLDIQWRVANAVSGTTDLRWAVRNAITGTLDLRWISSAVVAGNLDLRWRTANVVSGALDLRWVSAAASANTVAGTLDLRWVSAGQVSGSLDLRWAVRNTVSSSIALQWVVLNAVAGTLDLRWAVRSQISGSLGLVWVSVGRVSGTLMLLWVVNSDIRRPADIRVFLGERVTVRLDEANVVYRGGL